MWQLRSSGSRSCEGAGSERDYRVGQMLVLIGPDGNQLSSAAVSPGRLGPSEDKVNAPAEVCTFNFVLRDVPEVATYRLQIPDGTITNLSWSLRDVRDRGWKIGMSSKDIS